MDSHSDKMLRAAEVMARVGLSRTTIWRRVRAGTFPAPVELGVNAIGWHESEIAAWLESCNRRTYGAPADAAARCRSNTSPLNERTRRRRPAGSRILSRSKRKEP